MSVKMSSEGDSVVNVDSEKSKSTENDSVSSEVSSPEKTNTSASTNDSPKKETKDEIKTEDSDKSQDNNKEEIKENDKKSSDDVKEEKDKKESKTNDKAVKKDGKADKTDKKEKEKEKGGDDEDDEEGDEDEEDDDDDDYEENEKKPKSKPLLDQPLEKSGKRDRKSTQRFDEEFPSEPKETVKVDIPNGSGVALGNIPRIDASISRFKNDDMKLLHRILFKTPGKSTMVKRNIKKFNGFDFKKDSDEYNKKLTQIHNCELKQLKSICEMLDLVKTGSKEDISERILEFLMEPKDSGKAVGGGRPKRTAAVRANNRGYSSHDNYSSDEHPSRSSRDKGKRSNLKDDSSSASDEDFEPSDDEEKPRVKRKRVDKKKAASDEDDDDASEMDSESSDDDDDSDFQEESKGKRKKPNKTNNKPKGKGTGRRGRPPGSAKKAQKAGGKKRSKESSDEEESENNKEEGSSSEDEPLVKKAKSSQPPTDEEIKMYVKEILEGANLEQITMKTVCQQVYAHYPDFDLAHKKEFIKTTVRSLIST